MSGQQDPPPQQAQSNNSPPSTPPDSIVNDSDHRQSRKREREVSLEPVNTPKASDTDATTLADSRDARTPAKRNRRMLESTEEETEEGVGKASSRSRSRSHSVSPPIGVGVSPRQEIKIKVRQISQGVEELTWKTPKAFDKEQQGAAIVAPSILAPPAEVDEKTSAAEDAVITDVKEGDSQRLAQQEATDSERATQAEASADNGAASANVAPSLQVHVRSKSEGGEKGLKRRFGERGTSQGPNEGESSSKYTSEPLKRPRDDEGGDPNPRETKRPSPPPETEKTSPKTSPPSLKAATAPKLTGFMAYASVSPFAAAKGPSIFSSGKNTPTSIFASPAPSTPLSSFASSSGEVSSSLSKGLKRSGFEAFSSSPSPFSSIARSKSPILGQTSKLTRAKSPPARSHSANSNPFASYIGNSQSFVIPAQKRAKADSPVELTQSSLDRNSTLDVLEPNGSQTPEEDEVEEEEKAASFGEKLRAIRDEDEDSNRSEDDTKISLTEQEVITGEEEDYTIHQVRCKLFSLENGQWKERGTGMMRLNVKQLDGTGARLVMRKEAVYTLLINVTLFHGMLCTLSPQDPRYMRFSAIENGSTTHYNLRLGSAKAAQDLLNKVLSHIPPA